MPMYDVVVEINIRFTATVDAGDTTAARYAAIRKAKQTLEAVSGTSSLACSGWEVSEVPMKKNCWSCKNSHGERGSWLCLPTKNAAETLFWLSKPENSIGLRENGRSMPERTADNCPGWEQKP